MSDPGFTIVPFEHGVAVFGSVPISMIGKLTSMVEAYDTSYDKMGFFAHAVRSPEGDPACMVFGSTESLERWKQALLEEAERKHGKGTVRAWWDSPMGGSSSRYLVHSWSSSCHDMPLQHGPVPALPRDASDLQRCVDAVTYLGIDLSQVTFKHQVVPWGRIVAAWDALVVLLEANTPQTNKRIYDFLNRLNEPHGAVLP